MISELLGLPAHLVEETHHIVIDGSCSQIIERSVSDLVALGVYEVEGICDGRQLINRILRLIEDELVQQLLRDAGDPDGRLKLDVTEVLPAEIVGLRGRSEYPKTSGHYHTPLPWSSIPSPDFYQVLHGSGSVYLQSRSGGIIHPRVVDVSTGDVLVIPPEWGHATINTGNESLVFANICVRAPHLDYAGFYDYGGGAYRFYTSESGGDWSLNLRYQDANLEVTPLIYMYPNHEALTSYGIERNTPFKQYLSMPEIISLLTMPAEHRDLFDSCLLNGATL
jgi:glucose-6-phosphate isomerase, archaeal